MNILLNSYNICRTSIALGTLFTILFNSNYILFGNIQSTVDYEYYKYTLFFLFKDHLIFAKYLSIIILLVTAIGFYPRITGILHFYVTYSLLVSCDVIDGGDHLASNLTLLLAPITIFDNNKNHWTNINQINIMQNEFTIFIKKIFFLLILVQVSAVYLHAFVGKLFVEEWINGTASYYWFNHKYFGINNFFRPIFIFLFSNVFVCSFVTWGVLLLEFILSAFLIVRRDDNRRYWMYFIAVTFHFSILIVHGLFSFFFTMFGALTIYLIPENVNIIFNTKKILSWKIY